MSFLLAVFTDKDSISAKQLYSAVKLYILFYV